MADFELQIKNYRCFPDAQPLRLSLATSGFTSFVGINNAGKSAVLRFFFEFRPLLSHLVGVTGNLITALRGDLQDIGRPTVATGEQAFSIINGRDIEIEVAWHAPLPGGKGAPAKHVMTLECPRPAGGYRARLSIDGADAGLAGADVDFESEVVRRGGQPVADLRPFFDACRFMGSAMYLGPFRNAINVGATERYFDMAVGQQFTTEFQNFKSGGDAAANEAIYQLIRDIKRIFGFDELDINADPQGKTLQVFVDGRSFRLSELGAGIAQFILVLANVLVRRPTMVIIDEPEANLHATLQLDFLTTLGSYTAEGAVMFATHNLGLARAASDRVYSCKRVRLGESEVRPLEATPHLAEFLGELGFSAYRDLGFDSVLLVEGPSEVKTLQQWLRLARKDHEIVLLQLGGNSMINAKAEAELAEVQRISPNVSAVIDSERGKAGARLAADRQGFLDLCEKLNIPVLVTERRATENYLTDKAVKRAFGAKYASLGPFQLLKDAEPAWSKRNNWQAARHMTLDELAGTDLGDFLAKLAAG